MTERLGESQVAQRMNAFQEMIERDEWDAVCIDEAYAILKSYSRTRSRARIASLTVGDTVTFNTGRTRGNYPSTIGGQIISIGRSRVRIQESGHIRKWTIPVWSIVEHDSVKDRE